MGLPPSGPKVKELLLISTEDFDLTIKGPSHNKTVEAFQLHQDKEGKYLKAALTISPTYQWAKVYDPQVPGGLSEYDGGHVYPCFFEQSNYEFIIEKKEGCQKEISVDHLNQKLRMAITPAGNQGRILSGIINFNNEVGLSRFEILGENQILLSLELEVFPSKLDYEKDFWQILREVNEEIYNLAFDFLMKTSFAAALRNHEKPTQAEFYYILTAIFDKLFQALTRIERQPHYKIYPVNRVVLPEKVKRADAKTIHWLSKRTHLFQKTDKGFQAGENTYLPRRVLDRKKELTFDTYENRFLKWMVKQVDNKLNAFYQKYEEVSNKSGDPQVFEKINGMRKKLNRFRSNSFLKEVGELERIESTSLVMQMAPGYRDVFKYYLMILKGLQIKSDMFTLSIKNLAELYEYWCFLKLNKILREKYQLERNGMVALERGRLTVNLAKGKESTVLYNNSQNNEKFSVAYNKSFINLPTITQKPDNVLSLKKIGSNVVYNYIFDAKYRISVDEDYIRNFNQAGPPEDTINTMHRYRDSIVADEQNKPDFKRNIFGAFVLFPHNDEMQYAGQKDGLPGKFYKSIEQISIGAFPFLPGQTALVEEFLDELLLESTDTAFERTIIQDGTVKYLTDSEEKKNVLIGPLGRKEQLEVCLNNNMYYTYLSRVKSFLGTLEYIAIYQSKEKFRDKREQGILYYGRIQDFKILPRKEIKEMPVINNKDELAVKFLIDEWIKKDTKIDPGGYGPSKPQRTTWRLLKEAIVYPELHLDNLEVRLWRELRRYKECVSIQFPKSKIKDTDNLESITFPGLIVTRISEEIFEVRANGSRREYDFTTLNKRPGRVLREIINFWKDSG